MNRTLSRLDDKHAEDAQIVLLNVEVIAEFHSKWHNACAGVPGHFLFA